MEKIIPFLPIILVLSTIICVGCILKLTEKKSPHVAFYGINTFISIGAFYLLSSGNLSVPTQILAGIIFLVGITPLLVHMYTPPVMETESVVTNQDLIVVENTSGTIRHNTSTKPTKSKVPFPASLLNKTDSGGTMVQKNIPESV